MFLGEAKDFTGLLLPFTVFNILYISPSTLPVIPFVLFAKTILPVFNLLAPFSSVSVLLSTVLVGTVLYAVFQRSVGGSETARSV